MSTASEKEKLSAIARGHSYESGFNGRLGKYRIQLIAENIAGIAGENQVLEIGAGEGPITSYLSSYFNDVTAIEPADDYFALLTRRFESAKNVHLHHGLFEDWQSERLFPLIVAAGVLEHVQKPVDFVKKIARHLLPGGTLLATVPNAASLHRRLGVDMGMLGELHELSAQDHKVGHCRYYDFASFRGDIESGGLKVSKMEGLVLKPFPNSKMDELTEPFCDALFNVGRTLPEWGAEIFVRAEKGEQK